MLRTRLINLLWIFLAFAPAVHAEPPLQPDPVKTPGDVLTWVTTLSENSNKSLVSGAKPLLRSH